MAVIVYGDQVRPQQMWDEPVGDYLGKADLNLTGRVLTWFSEVVGVNELGDMTVGEVMRGESFKAFNAGVKGTAYLNPDLTLKAVYRRGQDFTERYNQSIGGP